jgi:hypothetical protein
MTHNTFFPRFIYSCIGLMVALVGLGLRPAAATDPPDVVVIPTQFDQDRFFAVPTTQDGKTLRMIADTGGGMFIFDDAARRLNLKVVGVNTDDYKGLACTLPAFADGKGIPTPQVQMQDGVFPVAPAPVRRNLSWFTDDIDGILGEPWFAGRVWTFDYVDQRLLLYLGGAPKPSEKAHRVEMGLRKPEPSARVPSYPRIQASIGGETFDMLLATGSAAAINANALKEIGEGPATRATSLISNSVFDRWKKEHPDWRVVSNAEQDSGEPMIEVPKVTVGGFDVGPVWFTQRPDSNFRDHFSEWMDKPVEGAIGSNALRGMRVTLDYSNRVAWFEKP